MPNYNRDEIRALIFKRLGSKVKKPVLDKHIEGLIDEYIEKQEFVHKHGLSIDDHPTKDQIKWWFQDRIEASKFGNGEVDEPLEIQVDAICLKDKIASEVFKHLYKFKYKQGEEVPAMIKQLIRLIKLAEGTRNQKNRKVLSYRINNVAIVGVIRFYHLERKPYLTPSQITRAINFFRNALLLIDKIESGDFKQQEIIGELLVFEAFRDTFPNKDSKKK